MHRNQTGFTLVELLIATTIFSVILLAATTTLIQVGRMYYKGVISSKTQNAARSITDDITRTLQFSGGAVISIPPVGGANPPAQALCFDDIRLSFALNTQVTDNVSGGYDPTTRQIFHGLWQDKVGDPAGCVAPLTLTQANPGGVEGKELLDQYMRLTKLSVTQSAGSPDVYNVQVGVAYGATDLFNLDGNGIPVSCKGTVIGGQWCAISEINTQVFRRVETN
jgi:prepilin-type N-terminal cleavage/methylation domain-containing protein